MCILIHHPSNVAFDDELLNDFYDHNPDGFGAMYVNNGSIIVVKTLGKPAEINALYRDTLKGRDCIIHYRMKTHGNIDMDNCHPYKVTDDLWMAHNGILSMGNPIDSTKSDTWHFIEYIIKPAVTANPDIILDADYQRYLESMIGATNKFAFLHSSGEIIVLNREAGVDHQGAWLSNTYAWSASKHGHGYPTSRYGHWSDRNSLYDDRYGSYYTTHRSSKRSNTTASTKQSSKMLGWDAYDPEGAAYGDYDDAYESYNVKPKKMNINKIVKAAHNCYRRGLHQLVDWVIDAPDKAEYLLIESYGEKEAGEMRILVDSAPEEAAEWLWDLFDNGNMDKHVAI